MRKYLSLGVVALVALVSVSLPLAGQALASGHCHDTGIGLDANYINETPAVPFTVTCDIGIYLDEGTTVSGVSIQATAADARPVQ